jgi:adenylate cyclase
MEPQPESGLYSSLDLNLQNLRGLTAQIIKFLQENRPASVPKMVYDNISDISRTIDTMHSKIESMEDDRRNLRTFSKIGQVVNSSLELDEVLQIVMDTIIQITGAERGFLMLRNAMGELETLVARNWEKESLDQNESALSSTVINRVVKDCQAILTTNAQEDPRFSGQHSIVAYNLRSILCVPLILKDQLTGVIYADNRIRSGLFTQKDLDLLTAFADQAAVALENASLFVSVRQTLEEVTRLKSLMDNVFASIASGVITADIEERVVLCNRAAEIILGRVSGLMAGKGVAETLPSLSPFLKRVLLTNQPVLGVEVSPVLPERGKVELRFSLSPLKDAQETTQGVAIVMEDLTEKKKLEAQHRMFERMVSPAVIEHLDPNSLQLGGRRTTVTVLFADIRGFTSYSESVSPEELVAVLNRYLAAAADAVLEHEGTVDKFLGDAVMAWFNAPIPQPDHTLRAVRSALALRDKLEKLRQELPISAQLTFGVGIHVGDAVLGLIGTEKRLDYTAIGDCVNTTKRIQENAAGGQILISQDAYARVADQVIAAEVDPIQAKGKREPIRVLEIVGLKT